MDVLVTGANGHVGSHTVAALVEAGHQVKALVREGADLSALSNVDVTLCRGDIMNAASLDKAVAGCEVVVHLAAVYKTWAKEAATIVEPALRGTENLFTAAQKAGVRRVVFTSSIAAVGVSKRPVLRDADDWNEDARNPYYVAKTESERAARALANTMGMELVVLCPSLVLGRLDYRMTPSTELIYCLANGQLPYAVTYPGGTNLVDVGDVALAQVKAVEQEGVAGRRFLVTSDNLESREIGRIIQQATGRFVPYVPLLREPTLTLLNPLEKLQKSVGMRPLVPASLLHENVKRWAWYDSSATWLQFEHRPKSAEQTIAHCLDWLLEQRLLRRKVAQYWEAKGRQAILG